MIRKLAAVVLVLLLPLCAAAKEHPHKKKKKPAKVIEVASVFRTIDTPISPDAKIFLISGSSLTASFSAEVAEQRRLWKEAGYKEGEIACYYVVPLQEDFNDDQKEYLKIAAELAHCYRANMKLIRSHLETVARRKPPFLYLYITSHGDQPADVSFKEAKPTDEDYWGLKRDAQRPEFNQFHILMEGLPDGTATSTEVLGALRAGMPPEDLYFTPKYLSNELNAFFPDTPKFIVLQGCFSGGFVEDPDPVHKADLLSSLKNVTVVTAARHDRSSFGCDPGGFLTFFGEAYLDVLEKRVTDPRGISWVDLFNDLTKRVTQLEKREKTTPPSLPQYFSNYAAPRR